MRQYVRVFETVSHFAYFDRLIGLFMQKWQECCCLTFSEHFDGKVTNSDQPGRPTAVAAFLVLYGENDTNNTDVNTHKS